MNLLDEGTLVEYFRTHYFLFVGALFLGTFFITYFIIPKVLWVSKERQLMAHMNGRSSHSVETPPFGGVAFYVTIILMLSFIQTLRLTYLGNHLIAAITILFMVGLKDDLVISTARVKLIGQVLATCFIVFSPELQLTTLHGFMGIYEIPEVLGYAITAFITIALINAYNFIDGIDGLAAMVGIVISAVYIYIFYVTGNPYYVLVSTGLVGILCAFLRYNLSRKKKIFMGDSGSLIIGLALGALSLKILVMEPSITVPTQVYDPANDLLLLACILFVPAFDTLRVVFIRIRDGHSPFISDRNHMHHVLIDLGLSHTKASFSLALLNVLVIGIYFLLSGILSQLWLIILVVFLYAASFALFGWLKIIGGRMAKGGLEEAGKPG